MIPNSFPFGQPVIKLAQQDRSPKKVFVLGVYASAVHAIWQDPAGKKVVNALAVASEPYIFWRGEGAESIISNISIPAKVGKLVPAPSNLNGPSGKALDDLFLKPMGVKREEAWLCDIVPHSCRNPSQAKAIQNKYVPLMKSYGLPEVTTPPVPDPLCDDVRRKEILAELQESGATTLVLLGDEPIRWFLRFFDSRWKKLGDFGETAETYGRGQKARLAGQEYDVIPLVHPRQASALGAHSKNWKRLHDVWIGKSLSRRE
jgi:hypothetical protein